MPASAGAMLRLAALSLGLGLAAGAAAQAPAFAPRDEAPEEFPEAPGREETFYACIACHNFKLVAAQGMSRPQWDDTLTWMTERHNMPEIAGAERDLILDYLAAQFPPRAPSRTGGFRNPFVPQ